MLVDDIEVQFAPFRYGRRPFDENADVVLETFDRIDLGADVSGNLFGPDVAGHYLTAEERQVSHCCERTSYYEGCFPELR